MFFKSLLIELIFFDETVREGLKFYELKKNLCKKIVRMIWKSNDNDDDDNKREKFELKTGKRMMKFKHDVNEN